MLSWLDLNFTLFSGFQMFVKNAQTSKISNLLLKFGNGVFFTMKSTTLNLTNKKNFTAMSDFNKT